MRSSSPASGERVRSTGPQEQLLSRMHGAALCSTCKLLLVLTGARYNIWHINDSQSIACGVACRSFDKDHIDASIMKKIQTYIPQPDFQPEKIEKVKT